MDSYIAELGVDITGSKSELCSGKRGVIHISAI